MKKKILLFSAASSMFLFGQTIEEVKYNNLNKISPKIVNEILEIKKGDKLDEKKLNDAIKKFYNFGYFDDISAKINKKGVLTLDFIEKPSISNIEIKGYKNREDEVELLKKLIGLKKGSMYTPKRAQRAKELLSKSLEQEGYIHSVVEVEVEKINKHSVSLVFNVNKGDEIIIKKANYYGAENLTKDDFDTVTANKEVESFSWFFGRNDGELKTEQLKYDSRRINELYFENGYLDAKVKEPFLNIDFASNQAKLDFFINEGEKYFTNDVKIYVDESIVKAKDIYDELKLIKGHTFNIKKLRRDQNLIKTKVANKGYAYAKVKFDIQKDEKTKKVNIVFSVIPGNKVYINDVKISGNSRTLDRVIRRNVYLAPGDLYNLTDLKDSKNKLQRTRYFDKVVINEKRVSKDKIDLHVEVIEAATGSLMLGGGYGSYDKLMINGSVKDANIFGSGISLGLSADLSSRRNKFSVDISNPSINDSIYNGSISLYNSESSISRDNYDLDKTTKGFTVAVGRELVRNLYGGLKYRLDDVNEKYDYDSSFTGTKANDQDYVVSSITPYINFDNTDNFYFPTEGFKIGNSIEFAGIGGDSQYIKTNSYLKYFYSIEDLTELDWVFRFKTQLRFLVDTGKINQGDSLYLGGPRTLRGYKSYAFGPEDPVVDAPYKKMWSNSIEVSFPLVPSAKMRWGLFYDFGVISQDYDPFRDNTYPDIKRSGAGALIEWFSPVGPLQLIFANALDNEAGDDTSNFEFSLGGSF